MTHGRLEQHLTYGKHSFWQAKSVFLLDRAQINYAERLEEGGRGQSLLTMTAPTNVDATSVLEGWATRDSKNTGHRFNVKTNTCLEDKFNYGEKTGVKANPNNASQETEGSEWKTCLYRWGVSPLSADIFAFFLEWHRRGKVPQDRMTKQKNLQDTKQQCTRACWKV